MLTCYYSAQRPVSERSMIMWAVVLLGAGLALVAAREPFKPYAGSTPFLVYFTSRYRGICVGTLVSRAAVLTAAVCVTTPTGTRHDTRPITVVTGSTYRHPRRGIRVQVTKILIPKLPEELDNRAYLLQKSAALLLLKRKVPDILVEHSLRPLSIDYRGDETLALQEECFMPGWHFFYRGDKIYPVHKFLLQRNVRVQFLNIVKMHMWCDALALKFQKSLASFGFEGYFDKYSHVCIRDPDRMAQPCHGMYGAPLVCRGRAVAMLMAPDAQWTNCTGFSNVVHLLHSSFLQPFMSCISKMFESEAAIDWSGLKKALYDEGEDYDYLPKMYDKVIGSSSSSDEL